MARVFIGIGSNLGDQNANFYHAAQLLLQNSILIIRRSPIYHTSPWGYLDQPGFLNAVLEIETDAHPLSLLHILKSIEKKIGRQQSQKWGPRIIDLDILFYDHLILKTPELTIPHPLIAERLFVLIPLADLSPDFVHPVLGKTISTLLKEKAARSDGERVEKSSDTW